MRMTSTAVRSALLGAAVACALAAAPAAAGAAQPFPEGPNSLPSFVGSPATAKPIFAPAPPQNPFMAPNGRSNIHDDAFMTDTYQGGGPLGKQLGRTSTFLSHECASLTFDSKDRI